MDRLKINSKQVRINLKPRRRLSRLNSKKDVTKTTLSKEQKELLLTLFLDIDIRFW